MARELRIAYGDATNAYAVLRRVADDAVWNGSAFVPWNDDDVVMYALVLMDRGGDLYTADFPPGIPPGTYTAAYYRRLGSVPAVTDTLLHSHTINWNGINAVPLPPGTVTAGETFIEPTLLRQRVGDLRTYTVTVRERGGLRPVNITAIIDGGGGLFLRWFSEGLDRTPLTTIPLADGNGADWERGVVALSAFLEDGDENVPIRPPGTYRGYLVAETPAGAVRTLGDVVLEINY